MALIEAVDLSRVYKTGDVAVRALDGVNLTIDDGEFVAIMGTSGSGKSTMLALLGCLDRPTSGTYRLAGDEVSRFNAGRLATVRNKVIGFVFQSFNLLARTTALENVELPLLYAGVGRRDRHARSKAALERVGLAERMDHTPSQMSGGQQQRVAIARAIVTNPRLLLADEPTGNLDSRTSNEVMALLQELHAGGLTVVLVTHEHDVAAHASRVIAMKDGGIMRDEHQTPVAAVRA